MARQYVRQYRVGRDPAKFEAALLVALNKPIEDTVTRRLHLILCLVWFCQISLEEAMWLELDDWSSEVGEVRLPKLRLSSISPRLVERNPRHFDDAKVELPPPVCDLLDAYIKEEKPIHTLFSVVLHRPSLWRAICRHADVLIGTGATFLFQQRYILARLKVE